MIVVTTPTGSIGSKLVEALLGANESRARRRAPPEKLAADGPRPRRGGAGLQRRRGRARPRARGRREPVPRGAALLPCAERDGALPAVHPAGVRGDEAQRRLARRHGLRRRPPVGAKAGVVTSSFAKDVEFERAGFHVRALWCPGFMENMLRSVESIRTPGVFIGPSRPDVKAPLVATRDIAASAARLLRDRSWTGAGGLAVLGPEDLSLNDIAAITGEVLGRPVRYQQVPAEAYKAQLLQVRRQRRLRAGPRRHVRGQGPRPRQLRAAHPETTTPTTYRAVVHRGAQAGVRRDRQSVRIPTAAWPRGIPQAGGTQAETAWPIRSGRLSRTERLVTGAGPGDAQGSASPWDRLWASYPPHPLRGEPGWRCVQGQWTAPRSGDARPEAGRALAIAACAVASAITSCSGDLATSTKARRGPEALGLSMPAQSVRLRRRLSGRSRWR